MFGLATERPAGRSLQSFPPSFLVLLLLRDHANGHSTDHNSSCEWFHKAPGNSMAAALASSFRAGSVKTLALQGHPPVGGHDAGDELHHFHHVLELGEHAIEEVTKGRNQPQDTLGQEVRI
ncbi:hypothetical protein DENSPDRAFT_845679 [Dentipellis sp. KUC8613]|nr:hypothetical protein DENSPDRAFT_845679 [Dentipellis sp. KUC8613]